MTSLLPLLRAAAAAAASSRGGNIPTSSWRLLGGVRHGSISTWNQDWRPGQFPTTDEERAAAAKKYGLLVEDYKPISTGEYGDYPELPEVGGAARDVYYNWDDPHERRNFGEPVHIHRDCFTEDRYEPQSDVPGYWPEGDTYGKMFVRLITILILFCGSYYLTCNMVMNYPILPKQYPSDVTCKGLKHYTFEIECD